MNNIIPIRAGGRYDVVIGSGLLEECGTYIRTALGGTCHVGVIADRTVADLYLSTVCQSLQDSGFEVDTFVYTGGEQNKNLSTLSDILEFLAEKQLTRTDCVIALGGGVTGDMAGFAAGCFLRGIRCVQLPTTLLAAVDSSVGGKTAVDLKAGKNLAGVFLQPAAVLCDTNCFQTLSSTTRAAGLAEAVKTGALGDAELFSQFEDNKYQNSLREVIARCVAIKGRIVAADVYDKGERRKLNLGHTIGHAVEKCANFTLPHGYAVAIGMVRIARAAARLGWSETDCTEQYETALQACGLPTETDYTTEELTKAALSDKKRTGESITLVIPQRIGVCSLKKIPVEELKTVIEAGRKTA